MTRLLCGCMLGDDFPQVSYISVFLVSKGADCLCSDLYKNVCTVSSFGRYNVKLGHKGSACILPIIKGSGP